MPSINVSGSNPNGPQPRNSGAPGGQDYARAQAQAARQSASDYAAAQAQASGKQSGEFAAWRQHAAAEQAHLRKMEALMAQEERAYASQLRDQARLQHRFTTLSARARDPLSPSSHSAFSRAHATLAHQNQMHAQRYGSPAIAGSALGELRTSVGTPSQAFHTANALRLGNLGQRAAISREYSELVRIQHELQRIEKTTERQAKFASSPTDQANLVRQRDALLTARQRISSGMSGNSPTTNRIGMAAGRVGVALGGAGALLANPYVDAAVAAVSLPYAANKMYAGWVGLQQPYLNFVDSTEQLARGGRFRGSDLRKVTMKNGGPGQYAPGFERSDFANKFALGPNDANQILTDYGVGVTGGGDARNVLAAARGAFLSPEMGGLSQGEYSKYLGQGRTLGAIQGGDAFNSTSNAYLNQLEKVMTLAVSQGLDRSRVASVMSGLQRQAAAGGALSIDAGDSANFLQRLVASGAPGMRDGSGEMALGGNIDKAAGGLGTSANIPGTLVMSSLFQKKGTPKTEKELQTFLGANSDQWTKWMASPAAQQAKINYLAAVKNGNGPLAQQYLGQLLVGHRDTMIKLFEQTPYANMSPDLAGAALANWLQSPLSQALDVQSGFNGNGGGAPGVGGMRPPGASGPNGKVAFAGGAVGMMDYFARKYDLTTNQAAGLTGIIFPEGNTTGNERGQPWGTGGVGIAQWTADRRKMLEKWLKANNYSTTSRAGQLAYMDQEGDFQAALDRVRKTTTVQGAADAAFSYENPPGQQLPAREAAAANYNAQYRGMTDAQRNSLNTQANGQAAQIDAAKYVSDATAVFKTATDLFSSAVAHFVAGVNKANTHARGFYYEGHWVDMPSSPTK